MKPLNLKFKLLIALIVFIGLRANAAEIWISTNGSDSNIGTQDLPLATLSKAVLKARQLRQANDPSIVGGIHIILKGGTYQLSQTLVLTQKDAGTAASPTYIEAAPGEIPVISGAVTVDGWQDAGVVPGLPAVAQNKIWVANTPQVGGATLNFRQLWADNGKRNRASTLDAPLTRLISVDKGAQNFVVPTPTMSVKNAKNMELTVVQDWELANLRVKTIDSLGLKTQLTFKQPEIGVECKRPWPRLSGVEGAFDNQYFFLSNAIELLNKPYEWYNDSTAGKLYYWPRAGEDKSTFQAYAPALETLIRLEGTLDSTVSYIKFKGISFEHTTWMRPSYAGHIPLQSGQYILDAYSYATAPGGNVAWVGRPVGGVTLKGASHINFDGCTFQHMAATGLDFVSGTHNDSVQGCVFTDIGGSGIQIGYFGDKDFEAHRAYNPADNREVCQFEVIKNNYITKVTNEDWGCIGISVGYASDISILHNEIGDVNYSAISVGWAWTSLANCMKNNKINANYIHGFANNMQDVGAIYTLSSQPNSQMIGNRIEEMVVPPFNANRGEFFVYLDEGTNFYNVADNYWPDGSVPLHTNQVGSSITFGTNGPSVSSTIKSAAGLEAAYKDLVLKVPTTTPIPADSIYEYVSCFTPLYKTGNLVTDPECTILATYKNWGNTAIISDANAYCGTSVQSTGKCGGSIDYSLTGKLLANTTYRLKALVYTNGTAGISLNGCGINGTTADYQYSFNTGSSWQNLDFQFTTGNLASAQNFWFNSCGGAATNLRLDNFEIYRDTLPRLSASTSAISFEGTTSASFTVSGANLTNAVTLTAPAGITLSTYSIPANPESDSVTVTYDGQTDLNDTILLTSTGVRVEILVKSASCFTPLYSNLVNMIPDPYLNTLTGFGGWGHKAIISGSEAYCGTSCVKFTAINNGYPDGAALDVSNVAWAPNATYRFRAMVKTVDGSCAFLANGTNPNFLKVIPQSGANWVVVDTTFTTGSAPTTGFFTFNNVDGTGTNGKIAYIDNYELYNITSLTALTTVGVENQNIFIQANSIVVDFELTQPSVVEISVFNAQGMLLKEISGNYNAGKNHKVMNTNLTSGICLVKMNYNGQVVTRKLLK